MKIKVRSLVCILSLISAFRLPLAAQTVGPEAIWMRAGQGKYVNALFFSPDGTAIVSASSDGTLHLLDAETRCLKRSFSIAGTENITAAAMSPDGKLLALGDSTGIVYILNASDFTLAGKEKPFTRRVSAVDFSPDGKKLLAACEYNAGVVVWEITGMKPLFSISFAERWLGKVCFNQAGNRIVAGTGKTGLELFDASTGSPVSRVDCVINTFALSPDRKTFAYSVTGAPLSSGSLISEVAVRSLADGKKLFSIPGYGPVVYSTDGKQILSAGPDFYELSLWNASTGEKVRVFEGAFEKTVALALSPDGKTVIAADANGAKRTWDGLTGKMVETNCGHEYTVNAAAVSPDGGILASYSSIDYSVFFWNLKDGAFVSEPSFMNSDGGQVKFFGAGRSYLMMDRKGIVHLYNDSGVEYQTLSGGKDAFSKAVPAPDGTTVAVRVEGKVSYIQILDAKTGKTLRSFKESGNSPLAMAYTGDGRTLVASYTAGEIRVLDPVRGETRFTITQGKSNLPNLSVSPDGRYFAVAEASKWDTPGTAVVYELAKGKKVASVTLAGALRGLAFSPDGALLAVGDDDSIKLFGTADWTLLSEVKCPSILTGLAFSPDGSRLAACMDLGVTLFPVNR
jgi:WD40 repeat protein